MYVGLFVHQIALISSFFLSLWETLYWWLCPCRTPYVCGYIIVGHTFYRVDNVIMKHPIELTMSLWHILKRWLCHCDISYRVDNVIVKLPIEVTMSLWHTLHRWLCHGERASEHTFQIKIRLVKKIFLLKIFYSSQKIFLHVSDQDKQKT